MSSRSTHRSSGLTGTYQIVIGSVDPPHVFPITIGEVISEDAPGVGAGSITQQCGKDAYTFGAQDESPWVLCEMPGVAG